VENQDLPMTKSSRPFFQKKSRWIFSLALALTVVITGFQIWNEPPLSAYEGKEVSKILEMMPQKDKERLEYFFREYIGWEEMGYVLFGGKPMALTGKDKKLYPFKSFSSFLYSISPRRIQSENGFVTWKKYEKFFPMKRFVFLYDETELEVNSFFINKESFLQKVQHHADDFKRILNRDVTGEELLREGMEKSLLSKVLCDHDLLMGILFGFGRNNAYLFHQRSQLASKEERMSFCKKCNFGDPWEKEFEELDGKYKEIGWISAYITGDHLKNLELIMFPGFCAALDDPETHQIKEEFLQTRKKIIDFYKGKDFLAATLQALTSDYTDRE
jgi:hypothetical protein